MTLVRGSDAAYDPRNVNAAVEFCGIGLNVSPDASRFAIVRTLRDGKLVRMESYHDPALTLQAVGMEG